MRSPLSSTKIVFMGMFMAIPGTLLHVADMTALQDAIMDTETQGMRHELVSDYSDDAEIKKVPHVVQAVMRQSVGRQTLMIDRRWPDAEMIAMEEEHFDESSVFKRYSLIRVASLPYLVRVVEKLKSDSNSSEEQLLHRVEMAADRVLVQLQGSEAVDEVFSALQGVQVEAFEKINDAGLYKVTLPEATLNGVPILIRGLLMSTNTVAFAEPDFLVHATVMPNDPGFGAQWAKHNHGQADGTPGADIEAISAWDIRTSAANIIVAVTDTGVRYTHEDLRNNMWINPGEIAGDLVDNDGNGVVDDVYGYNGYENNGNPFDVDGHGTHVAGIIGAEGNNGIGVCGVAWDVQLMALKFLHNGTGTTSDGIKVIDYAIAHGAHIINASWGGGGYSLGLYNAIGRASNAGIAFVAAAGNDGYNTDNYPHYPAAYTLSNIISVASTTRMETLSSFSNFGVNSVDIAAPGSSIYSTYDASDSAYVSLSGTSMAAPSVAGMLALLKAEFTNDSVLDLIERLYLSAEPFSAYAGKVSTGGRVNLREAMNIPVGLIPASIAVGIDDLVVAQGSPLTLRAEARGTEPLNYTWTLNEVVIPGATEAELKVVATGPASSGVYRLTVDNAYGSASTEATVQALSGLEQIGAALDRPGSTWSLAGDALWRIQGDTVSVGNRALRSGLLADQQITEINTWVEGPGTVAFRWKVSSESYFDYTHFLVNNSVVYSMSGNIDWRQIQHRVPAGKHLLRWIYNKDYAVAAGADAAYLDSFSYIPDGVVGPTLVAQPDTLVSGASGQSLTLEVVATGTGPLRYQWYFDGVAMPGQDQATLTFLSLTAMDAGVYQLWVDNGYTRVASREITLSVATHAGAPTITIHPQDVVAAQRDTVAFAVSATGNKPMAFQWLRDGEPLQGQNQSSLRIPDIDFGDTGYYEVWVTNAYGAASSVPAYLRVYESQLNMKSAVDSAMGEWLSSGDRAWYRQQDVVTHGSSALVAGDIIDGESSTVQLMVDAPGTLYFSWKVSSEKYYDNLSLYNNGDLFQRISGEVDWTDAYLELGAGNHNLAWVYAKDAAYGAGYDTAWLDRVVFIPGNTGAPHVFVHPESAQVELGSQVELRADAVGHGTLNLQWLKDGAPIPGATERVYTIPAWQASNAGAYRLEATNALGLGSSDVAVMGTVLRGDYQGYFINPQPVGKNWIHVKGLGYLEPSAFPWVYHAEHGWWYMAGAGNGAYWIFDLKLGWIWMSHATGSYFWQQTAASWVYYAGSDGSKRWFMQLASQDWMSEPLSGI